MIKSLSLQNFQSHENTTLEFSEGVNAIVGPSDSGKTALIRAIRWGGFNRPLGDEMRSNWGGDTIVEIGINTLEIGRQKDKLFNGYFIREPNGQTSTFQAIRQEVPEEIQRALNINEINLQMQLDAPFLLSQSAGEVGAHFNRVAHIDVIDRAITTVGQWTRQLEQDIKSGERHLQEQQEKLKEYAHLDEFQTAVELVEALDKRYATLSQQIIQLRRLIQDISEVEEQVSINAFLLKSDNIVEEAIALFEDIHKKREQYNDLLYHLRELSNTQVKYDVAKREIEELKEEFEESFPDICPLCGATYKR